MKIAQAWMEKLELEFIKPARTSRDVLKTRMAYYIFLEDENGHQGIGECAPIFSLSIEDRPELEMKLSEVIYLLNHQHAPESIDLTRFPSIKFALDTAENDLTHGGNHIHYPSAFTEGKAGIPINGLIWMDELEEMWTQVEEKVRQGFDCIKLKIGAHDFEKEGELLKKIREKFGYDLTLRLDANGAFTPEDALRKLEILNQFDIHSIEQPIRAGQWSAMKELCKNSPIPIALDEELIGVKLSDAEKLLDEIQPQYIILKPSLIGGLTVADHWIEIAEKRNIGWWATSALESNVGLNAIAQWVYPKNTAMHQGLGTGQLFTNNVDSPLTLKSQHLYFDPEKKWQLEVFQK